MDEYTKPILEKSALIIIDIQNDFTIPNATAEIKGTINVIPKIKDLVALYRKLKRPIYHIIRIYNKDASNVDLCRKKMILEGKEIAIPNTPGAQIVEEVLPQTDINIDFELLLKNETQKIGHHEWIIYKSRWGAFYNTKLNEHLQNNNINTLVFCGCNFPNCPRTSMYEASERDYKIIFLKDATSQVYEKGLQELSNIGVKIMDTKEFIVLHNQY
ncbi:cysteine hydrolase family protein [Mariniflexile gromovii]|uniref:Cysteine hydrolase n=1 Tax=Mariniflexile gromovii TaxID=362523 RepID=A0ABS4BWV8_9FLAO|nr:isochorismatase family cysteine hydrolase [Mariniflexile gromovii]MBP0905062.1 cysteine hydrolase [Mariniflexile gromovii]